MRDEWLMGQKVFKKNKSKFINYLAKLLKVSYTKLSSKDKKSFEDAAYVVYMADVDYVGIEDACVSLSHMKKSFHEVFNYHSDYWENNKFVDKLDKLTD